MGSQRVGCEWAQTALSTFSAILQSPQLSATFIQDCKTLPNLYSLFKILALFFPWQDFMHPWRFISKITFYKYNISPKKPYSLNFPWWNVSTFDISRGRVCYTIVTNNAEVSVAASKKVLFIITTHVHHGSPGFSAPCHHSSHSTSIIWNRGWQNSGQIWPTICGLFFFFLWLMI